MAHERTYFVTYDISDQRRWRQVYKIMNAYGKWLQLSVFQCRLSSRRRAEMEAKLRQVISFGADHVLIIDLGRADKISIAVTSIGKTYAAINRDAVVI